MTISNYGENALLNTLRNVSFSVANVYIKLHTGNPGEDGTGSPAGETTRKIVTFSPAVSGIMTSSSDAIWTNVSTGETYSHISLWDDISAGNCLWYGALSASRTVIVGDDFKILSGNLSLTLD